MSAILLPEMAAVDVATPGPGVVYTETIVWSAPTQFVQDAPYQLAIVTLASGERLTGRITGEKVNIGDHVGFAEWRSGIPFFRKQA